MVKIKASLGFAVMVSLLAITATSAFALFSSENGKSTTGKGFAGKTEFIDEGAVVECAKAVGTWKLTKGAKGSEVAQATGAENLNIHVNASNAKPAGWESCKAKIGEATVGECELQIKQTAKGQSKGLGSVIKGCKVEALGCTIKVPAGSGGSNEGLEEILGKNSGNNLVSEVNVKGITSEAEGSLCKAGGITNLTNKVGKEKGIVTGEGLKEE